MPVTYEEFKKQFDTIKTTVTKYAEEIGKNERYMGQTTGVISEGTKEVGLRVQVLKDGGMKGATIDAFMSDGEVKTMVTEIRRHLAMMQKELLKATALQADIKKTVGEFSALKTEVATEIAARKRALSTKAGTGNKSLPEMEKLLAEMKSYTDAMPFAKVESFQSEKYDEHLADTNAALLKEVTQAKEVALSTFQKQMQEQALNTRVLNTNVGTARNCYTTVIKQCSDGQKALLARKNKELMTAKALLTKPWKDLQDMNDMYQDAMKDEWIASKIKTSKDKGTIDNGVKQIAEMKIKAGLEVAKIANAKV